MKICSYILLLIGCLFIGHVQAQNHKFVLSGGIQIVSSDGDQNKIAFTPRITYSISDHWAIGILYKQLNNKLEYTQLAPISGNSSIMWNFKKNSFQQSYGALVQYTLYSQSKLKIFAEGDAHFGQVETETSRENILEISERVDETWDSGIHLGGRYNFYKGLGAEFRLMNLVHYSQQKSKDNAVEDSSSITFFENFLKNSAIGLSYSF